MVPLALPSTSRDGGGGGRERGVGDGDGGECECELSDGDGRPWRLLALGGGLLQRLSAPAPSVIQSDVAPVGMVARVGHTTCVDEVRAA